MSDALNSNPKVLEFLKQGEPGPGTEPRSREGKLADKKEGAKNSAAVQPAKSCGRVGVTFSSAYLSGKCPD